jgi:hypothetical protein
VQAFLGRCLSHETQKLAADFVMSMRHVHVLRIRAIFTKRATHFIPLQVRTKCARDDQNVLEMIKHYRPFGL